MMKDEFKQAMLDKKGAVVIMAGSGSDSPHIEKILKSLKPYPIATDVRIRSAHKQDAQELVDEYNEVDGLYAIVAVAGGTDALSGTAAFHAYAPVISCPPDTRFANKEKYQNPFNESCLTNPPGSPNAYVARPENVGKLVAQLFAGVNPEIRRMLQEENAYKINSLVDADAEYQGGR